MTTTRSPQQEAFKPWVDDVKAIFYKDLFRNGTRPERCQGAGYMWLRFGQVSAHPAAQWPRHGLRQAGPYARWCLHVPSSHVPLASSR